MTGGRGTRPIARHGQFRTPRATSQLLKFIAIGLAVILVSTVGVAAYVIHDLTSTVSANAVDIDGQEELPPDIGEYKGGFNLVLTGIDKCEPEYAQYFPGRCDGPDSDGTLNDVNLLIHVSDEPRRVTVVSLPRDMMVPFPECEDAQGNRHSSARKQQINGAYTDAGINCVVKTIGTADDLVDSSCLGFQAA